jgi:hypothetical protein
MSAHQLRCNVLDTTSAVVQLRAAFVWSSDSAWVLPLYARCQRTSCPAPPVLRSRRVTHADQATQQGSCQADSIGSSKHARAEQHALLGTVLGRRRSDTCSCSGSSTEDKSVRLRCSLAWVATALSGTRRCERTLGTIRSSVTEIVCAGADQFCQDVCPCVSALLMTNKNDLSDLMRVPYLRYILGAFALTTPPLRQNITAKQL